MKNLTFIFVAVLTLSSVIIAQDWKINILVKGNLPDGTELTPFRQSIENTIYNNNNIIDSTVVWNFDINTVTTSDTTYHEVKIEIKSDLLDGTNKDTFETQINNFFTNKFISAILRTRFFTIRQW